MTKQYFYLINKHMRAIALAIATVATLTLSAYEKTLGGNRNAYVEPRDTTHYDEMQWKLLPNALHFTWASKDTLYRRHEVPNIPLCRDTVIYAWRGERVSMEGLLYSPHAYPTALSIEATANLKVLKPRASWMRYALTDDFSTCGYHPTDLPAWTVADIIDNPDTPEGRTLQLSAEEVRPFWVSLEVPRNCKAGEYTVDILLRSNEKIIDKLTTRIVVLDRQLPTPAGYSFHLDLWQQPYSVARFYGVEPWSKEHLNLLRPYMQELARMGQKVVSAILFYEPWGQQSNDKFLPMVQSTLHIDGTWSFDYTIFDRWVRFMQSCGISEQIDCYSMIPWDMSFEYYNEGAGELTTLKCKTTDESYKKLWTSFLKDFAKHLRKRGWFDKTCIAMDERGLPDMLNAYAIAQEAVPGIQMALAGNAHPELVDKLQDYAIAYGQLFSAEERAARRQAGRTSTMYTCCTDAHPGLFSNSNPADAAWIPLYCYAAQFDGWLHWSWLNWTDDPLRDTRFFLFAPGDTYLFYPGLRSSPRHERLLEGIQQFEKIKLLQNGAVKTNDTTLIELNAALQDIEKGAPHDAPSLIRQVNKILELVNKN